MSPLGVLGVLGLAAVVAAASPSWTVIETSLMWGKQRDWILVGQAPEDLEIKLVFALKPKNTDYLFAMADAVSDPKSPLFMQYITELPQLRELFTDEAAVAAVHGYLQDFTLLSKSETPVGEYISVHVPAREANRMLNTKFHVFRNPETGTEIARAQSLSLPLHVAPFVHYVGYGTTFPPAQRRFIYTNFGVDKPTASGQATPAVYTKFYGIDSNVVTNDGSKQCVFETIGQSYVPNDLKVYAQQYNVPVGSVTVIGPNDPSSCANPNNCVEASLDIQLMMALAQTSQSNPTTFWSVPGSESFLEWTMAVASDPNPPLVHSISYGESEKESSNAQDKRFDAEVAKLALRGISLMVSSGDDGAAGSNARNDPSQCGFDPSYPASANYITAVGATQGPESNLPEVACTSNGGGVITTGGGFSNVFPRPSWQDAQVQSYLNNAPNLPPSSMWNQTGRGYPDVALMGHNVPIVVEGNTYVGSGTSASSPAFAAMITLINSARMDAGKKPLGFLNPKLYSLDSSVWNDITVGENNCCAGHIGQIVCCQYGFNETSGWSPLTGLGTAKFGALKSALMAL